MKILFIADILPDISSGSAVRNYYLLKTLSKEHTVDFIGLTDNKENLNMNIYRNLNLKNYQIIERKKNTPFKKILYLLKGQIPYIELRKQIDLPQNYKEQLITYDAIHLAELNSYFFIEKYLSEVKQPIILDAHNVEYIRFSDEIKHKRLVSKITGNLLVRKLKQYEIQALASIKLLLVCSDVDQQYFVKYLPEKNIFVIPNGVSIAKLAAKNKPVSSNAVTILFMGLLSYFPNEEGLQYYFTHIHPVLIKKIPTLRICIIGKEPPSWLLERAEKDSNIAIQGFVEDTKPYITKADICIAPLLSGSGTRLKILEYMAMRKPVVSTPKAAEGIAVTDKKDIILAENAQEFVDNLLDLSKNRKEQEILGRNARKLVEDKYDWENIGRKLLQIYKTI